MTKKGETPVLDGTIALMRSDLRHFKIGQRFYTKAQAAQRYGVSLPTAGIAMHALAQNGYLAKPSPNSCFYVINILREHEESDGIERRLHQSIKRQGKNRGSDPG